MKSQEFLKKAKCTREKLSQCDMIAFLSYRCMLIWLVVGFNIKIIFLKKYKVIVPCVVLNEKSDANLVLVPL